MDDKRAELLQAMVRIGERLRAARLHTLAVQADAAATLERMRRARAQRTGVEYVPDDRRNQPNRIE